MGPFTRIFHELSFSVMSLAFVITRISLGKKQLSRRRTFFLAEVLLKLRKSHLKPTAKVNGSLVAFTFDKAKLRRVKGSSGYKWLFFFA